MTGAAAGPSVTVATWNIRAAIGPGEPFPPAWWRHVRRDRLEAIAAFIRGLDADVVCLQEVALGSVDGVVLDQPLELGRLTGMSARYGAMHHYALVDPDLDRTIGAVLWGNAILSRHPIVATSAVALPIPADEDLVEPAGTTYRRAAGAHPLAGVTYGAAGIGPREARCVLDCSISLGERTVRVLATHLSYVGAAQRRSHAEAIVGVAEGPTPVVVAGDLNAEIDMPEVEPLRAALADAFSATGTPPGAPERNSCGPNAIDHVFVRGLTPISCEVRPSAGELSDHWPVRAVLALD